VGTATPGDVRALVDPALGDTRRISVPIDEGRWQCPETIWEDE
jgi:hypothetical protein